MDILLHERVSFTCPWTQKRLTYPHHYDLDPLLPLVVYPINELWNLLPVDRNFNQRVKRDRVPSGERLRHAEPHFITAYENYGKSTRLSRVMHEDAALRFAGLTNSSGFASRLAQRAIEFIEDVSNARYVSRF
ncbi:hypothetical protein [Hymenobacter fodinae]|uniref:hypothetical protein n=1 Tax=Hymenobacter fodinae TaxID=2510796 RepID=UPI001AEC4861|nr:hypothetical protein [Hymenobacter fodinae]